MPQRHLLPCQHTALATAHYRLSEANAVKKEVDTALVAYTVAAAEPLPYAYSAAARLHARIEQLLEIYKVFPSTVDELSELLDLKECPTVEM